MTRYDPFEEMDQMFEQMRTRMWTPRGRFGADDFGRRLGTASGEPTASGAPVPERGGANVHLTERDGEYVFVADLPGFETEEIDLAFEDGALVISAESQTSEELADGDDELTSHHEFARSRRVSERVTIPAEIEEERISATYRNGVLEVHLPLVESEHAEDDGTKIDVGE